MLLMICICYTFSEEAPLAPLGGLLEGPLLPLGGSLEVSLRMLPWGSFEEARGIPSPRSREPRAQTQGF